MLQRKGILLAGGTGSRLYPLTAGLCKQLLPVYDKPMIYYPLSVLMLADVSEVMIISTPTDTPILERILGDGSRFGLDLSYKVQEKPQGIAQALTIAEEFLAGAPSILILGDNLLFGQDLTHILRAASQRSIGATIFGCGVSNPSDFGVVEFDEEYRVISLEEKPAKPRSRYAVPGLYFYDENACDMVRDLRPSNRGELEITELNQLYLAKNSLHMGLLGRGCAWLDMGTHESLHRAAVYVEAVQSIQGYQIANLEEVAFRKGWISSSELEISLEDKGPSSYKRYLQKILADPGHRT